MPNTLEDLRSELFATLKDLRDKDSPMSIERAKAVAEVADQIIKSAKTEVEYLRVLGRDDLQLPVFEVKDPSAPPAQLPEGVRAITTHRTR